MPTCNHCGGHVTERFARVLGNNDNEVWGCLGCGAKMRLSGRVHTPDIDHTAIHKGGGYKDD